MLCAVCRASSYKDYVTRFSPNGSAWPPQDWTFPGLWLPVDTRIVDACGYPDCGYLWILGLWLPVDTRIVATCGYLDYGYLWIPELWIPVDTRTVAACGYLGCGYL
jgi:hypothetical protein